jgi:hypothetical protein
LVAGFVVERNEHLFDLPNALRAIIWMRRIRRVGSAASTRMRRISPDALIHYWTRASTLVRREDSCVL